MNRKILSVAVAISGVALLANRGIEHRDADNQADIQRLTVTATAFNSTVAQTDRRPHETSCGDRLTQESQIIAVSRDLKKQGLDCGTRIDIDGLDGTWTVADVTAARHRQLIDIYMGENVRAARQWGRQKVEIRWQKHTD
jgi:3D (Asp-Asp-Asp) domain-containing protein